MRDWLREGFRYDLWANRLLLSVLEPELTVERCRPIERHEIDHAFPIEPAKDRAVAVFLHIVWAQKTWLSRVGQTVYAEGIERWLDALNAGWLRAVEEHGIEDRIRYSNFAGQTQDRSFGEAALQVINHGTYHRGQIRKVLGDVPGTDLISYFIERD